MTAPPKLETKMYQQSYAGRRDKKRHKMVLKCEVNDDTHQQDQTKRNIQQQI